MSGSAAPLEPACRDTILTARSATHVRLIHHEVIIDHVNSAFNPWMGDHRPPPFGLHCATKLDVHVQFGLRACFNRYIQSGLSREMCAPAVFYCRLVQALTRTTLIAHRRCMFIHHH